MIEIGNNIKINDKTCSNCKYYEKFNGVCCNGLSEWRADFRDSNSSCKEWIKNDK